MSTYFCLIRDLRFWKRSDIKNHAAAVGHFGWKEIKS